MPLLDLTNLQALEQELAQVRRERQRLEAEEAHLVEHIAEVEEKCKADYSS